MKIAVTAANGGLGSSIIKILKDKIGKENIVGLARTPENAKHLDIEIRKGDYNNKSDLLESLKGIDTVLLVSGMDAPDKRIIQHRNVLEAAKGNGVKKIVYTSIFGAEEGNAFSPIVASNRQTEEDIRNSGLNYVIGRNGLYIDADLEYIDKYIEEGGIINCADKGKCGYTSRQELACAYFNLLTQDSFNNKTYNLLGEATTQDELAIAINKHWKTNLKFKNIPVKDYIKNRQNALGEFMGTVIGGIYEGIKLGKFEGLSHFEEITHRPHKTVDEMISDFIDIK